MEPLIAKPSSSGGGMSRPPPPEPASLEAAVTEASTSEMAQIFTRVEPPFRITHVNDAWVDLCGFSGAPEGASARDDAPRPNYKLLRRDDADGRWRRTL